MCNPGVVGALAQGVGTAVNNQTQAQNQINHSRAQTQALSQTSDRQRLLRSLERQRQNDMNTEQMAQFQQAAAQADPDEMRGRQEQMQTERRDLSRRVGEQTSADSPLPGTSIPGGSRQMEAANRVVAGNLSRDAESLGERSAGLNAFPESIDRLSALFQGPQFNIGRIGRDSQMSAGLLPNEMDAARIAPRVPAPNTNPLGQILAGIGPQLIQQGGIRRGQQDHMLNRGREFQGMIPMPAAFSPFGQGGG